MALTMMLLVIAITMIAIGGFLDRARVQPSSALEFWLKRMLPWLLYGAGVGLMIWPVIRYVIARP